MTSNMIKVLHSPRTHTHTRRNYAILFTYALLPAYASLVTDVYTCIKKIKTENFENVLIPYHECFICLLHFDRFLPY